MCQNTWCVTGRLKNTIFSVHIVSVVQYKVSLVSRFVIAALSRLKSVSSGLTIIAAMQRDMIKGTQVVLRTSKSVRTVFVGATRDVICVCF